MVNLSETLLGDQLPFEDHLEDQIVLMTGGGVMAMWSVEGVYPDTSDKLDEENWFGQLHTAIKNRRGSRRRDHDLSVPRRGGSRVL